MNILIFINELDVYSLSYFILFSEVKWLLTLISDPCPMTREAKPRFFSERELQRDYEFGSIPRASLSQ